MELIVFLCNLARSFQESNFDFLFSYAFGVPETCALTSDQENFEYFDFSKLGGVIFIQKKKHLGGVKQEKKKKDNYM